MYEKEQQKVQRMVLNFTSYLGLVQSPKHGCLVPLEMLWDIYMGLVNTVQKPYLLVEHLEMSLRGPGFGDQIKPHGLQWELRERLHVMSTF